MPRKKLIRTNLFPYHVTARCNNKENFCINKREAWNIFSKVFRKITIEFKVKIHCFVLMENHFHLMITTPNENLDEVMYWVMKTVTLEIQKKSGRINRIFGGRYKWSLIRDEKYYYNVYKYIALNPVNAGITKKVEHYTYSTFHFLKLLKSPGFPTSPLLAKEYYFEDSLWEWLNYNFNAEEYLSIKNGITKPEFTYRKNIYREIVKPSALPLDLAS
jgi:putative transposase